MEDQNNKLDKYIQAVKAITDEQSKIVGVEVAMQLARNVNGLEIDGNQISIAGDPKVVLQNLVNQYSILFGKISIEVSKEAIDHINPHFSQDELPDNLK